MHPITDAERRRRRDNHAPAPTALAGTVAGDGGTLVIIDLVQLRTFAAVADEQHLTRAAERLHISQSAASTHIRAVEESLGVRLFDRTTRGLELTSAGRALMQRVRTLLQDAVALASHARELQGRTEGRLVIGAPSDPQATQVAAIVTLLRGRHPLVHVNLRQRSSMSTTLGLKTGELDAAYCLGRALDPELEYLLLTRLRYRVAGPVAWAREIAGSDWAALARLPWLGAFSSSVVSNQLMQLFAEQGLTLNEAITFDNAAIARQMVTLGAGVMLMREEYALQGEREGVLAVSPIAQLEQPLYVAYLAGRRDDPLISALLEATKTVWPGVEPVGRAHAPTP